MDVLQTSQPVVGRPDAEQGHHAVVPGRRQLGEVQRAVEQLPLQPVAQDDMGRIGHLVGVDPDEVRLNPGPEAVQVVDLPGRPLAVEGLAGQGRQEGQEVRRAAGLHLDQQGLALVHGHAAGLTDRLQAPIAGQAALVEGVPRLVQHGHQG